jgi:hypothetical protein
MLYAGVCSNNPNNDIYIARDSARRERGASLRFWFSFSLWMKKEGDE